MKRFATSLALFFCLLVLSSALCAGQGRAVQDHSKPKSNKHSKHVLLISVDGLHALDLRNYIAANPNSTLAQLSGQGITFTNAFTSQPSDSFPGLASLVTGGSPTTAGLWYDVTYNRSLAPPALTTPYLAYVGAPGGNCTPGVEPGTIVEYDESIDTDLTALNGGGGINPGFLPRDPSQGCAPIYPHQYLRTNTIFEVVKAHRGYTAWTDKHPSYEWTNGPSGNGVTDFYGPEINSIPVALAPFPGIPSGTGAFPTCTQPGGLPNFVDATPDDGWTTNLLNIMCYDETHVQAVLNQINGLTHDGSASAPVPTLFGTNFQAVSVGEKLSNCGNSDPTYPTCAGQNGYTDVLGTPSAGLNSELNFVDASLGLMVNALQKAGIYNDTLIVISAKHGQSPIDITKRTAANHIGGQPTAFIATVGAGNDEAFDISDDGSLIWLNDQTQTDAVVSALAANQDALGIQEIFADNSLKDKWNDPTKDPRTPDIILKVNTGVIYSGSSKLAEHGGLNEDDLHVALLFSNPQFDPKFVKTYVVNQQVAPTILNWLGIDPDELDAVHKEGITPLPFIEPSEQN